MIRGLAAFAGSAAAFLRGLRARFGVLVANGGRSIAGYIHLSPLYFLYDGYSAVYIFFALSGYVLTRSFERNLVRPSAQVMARAICLGLPALAATIVAVGGDAKCWVSLTWQAWAISAGSAWLASQWDMQTFRSSRLSGMGAINALFLGYSGMPGVAFLAPWQQPVEQSLRCAAMDPESVEFYGSMIILCSVRLCAAIAGVVVVDHANGCDLYDPKRLYLLFRRSPPGQLSPRGKAGAGSASCCRSSPSFLASCCACSAEIWQPQWLRSLCAAPTYFLFPGPARTHAAEDLRRNPRAGRNYRSGACALVFYPCRGWSPARNCRFRFISCTGRS